MQCLLSGSSRLLWNFLPLLLSNLLVKFTNHPPLLNILTFWNYSYLKTFDFEGLLIHLYQWINFNILPSYLVWALCPARFRHWARGSRETVGNLLNITLSLQSLLFSNYLLPLLICAVSNICSKEFMWLKDYQQIGRHLSGRQSWEPE